MTWLDLETKLDAISNAINEIEDYSYQFNIKLIGVPETSANESSRSTSSLYFKLFNDMGAKVTILDIDTAHRVPSRSDCGSSQNRSFANLWGVSQRNVLRNVEKIQAAWTPLLLVFLIKLPCLRSKFFII